MLKTVAIASLATAVGASKFDDLKAQKDFTSFMNTYGKKYEMDEVFERFSIFRENMKMIASHDAAAEGWSMGMNEFADMTWEEFSGKFKGYNHRNNDYARSKNYHEALSGEKVASAVDWVTMGAVTAVKNQAQCGSCWAFSTTGSIEGAHEIATGDLVSLSEQQLVDCAGKYGNEGCNGGLMDNAFEYVIKNGGLGTEDSYSYKGKGGSCHQKVSTAAKISSYKDVKNEDDLMSAVNVGPVSIAIEADQSGFQFYKSGVFSGKCGKQLDHGVLLVGYGNEDGKDFWKIKNSWGASWGENGYIRFERGVNMCGLGNSASYPIV